MSFLKKNSNLKEIIHQYERSFQQLHWASLVCDSNGIIQMASDTFYELIESNKQELNDRSIIDFISFHQDDNGSDYFGKIKLGQIKNMECNLKTKSKEIHNIQVTLMPIMKKSRFIGTNIIFYPELKEVKDKKNLLNENISYGQRLSNTGSWTHDIQKDEMFFTDEVYNILECKPEEFDGNLNQYYNFVHPKDLEKVKKAIEESIKGKEYDLEYRIITPNHNEKYVHEITKVLYDVNNKPIKMIGIMQETTKFKRIENNLKEIGDTLNLAQMIEGIGTWKYDVRQDKIFWSEEIYRIFDVDTINFKNDYISYFNIIHPDDKYKIIRAIENCFKGEAYEIILRVIKSDSTISYIKDRGEPIYNEKQRIIGLIGTIQDITEKKLLEDKLKESYSHLKKAQSLAHIGSWKANLITGQNIMSDEALRILGISGKEFDGSFKGFLKYVHFDDISLIDELAKSPPKGQFLDMEFRIIKPDGSVRNVYQIMEYKFDKKGNPIFLSGTIQDITDRKEMETDLVLSKKVYLEESYDFYELLNPSGRIIYISCNLEEIFGYHEPEMIGKVMFDFYNMKVQTVLIDMFQKSLDNPDKNIKKNIILKTKLGKQIYYEVTMINKLNDPSIHGIIVYWSDITKRVELESKITYLADHDELTKLPNRNHFRKCIQSHCDNGKRNKSRFALIILDIEGFRYFYDALGYHLADQLIIEISNRLKKYIGNDQCICRYSGDQFAIIIEGLYRNSEYENYIQKLLSLFSTPFKVDKYELYVTINIGVSIYPEDGHEAETLKKHANIAMYRTKNQGKNRYQFYSIDMDIQSFKEFQYRNDMYKSIELNQMKVYYQPLINLQTNEIIAVEALIRWEHPTWGLVPPNEFLPIAEETGFIIELGKWILEEVSKNYKEWMDRRLPPIKVSVNYSSIQFYEKNFVEKVLKIINHYSLDPHFLIVEIVESVLINDFNQVSSDIKKLQQVGIQIALDDFGTGYSSLEYLSRFNFDIIKIDRSFIKNILKDETNTIITETIIILAKRLKMKLVVEGIETWDQLLFLRKLNCLVGQGFLYSKPVDVKTIERMLAQRKCKPVILNNGKKLPFKERRKYFRIELPYFLEAVMTITHINGKATRVGYSKALIHNIGPGGLCFMTKVRFPIKRDIIIQFSTELMEKELKVYGRLVWAEEIQENIHQYGIEFTFSENEQEELTRILNQYQVRLRNNNGQYVGSFIHESYNQYFNLEEDEIIEE